MTGVDNVASQPGARPRLDRRQRRSAGRRTRTVTGRPHGRFVRALRAGSVVTDVAFDATLRAAAARQTASATPLLPLVVRRADIHRKQRVAPRSTTILFVVDASWSMAVSQRMRAARGAMFALLADAYQRRDRVGLITFRNARASVRLRPTGAVGAARRALRNLAIGGKTPLASALVEAARVFRRERLRQPDADALMVMLTDGAANVAIGGGVPLEQSWRAANRLRRSGVRSVVIDAERPDRDRGLARTLAGHLGAGAVVLSDLRADLLYRAVRGALDRS